MRDVSPDEFLSLLDLESATADGLRKIPSKHPTKGRSHLTFVRGYGNSVSREIMRMGLVAEDQSLLIFADTNDISPLEHPTSTESKPDKIRRKKKLQLQICPNQRKPSSSEKERVSNVNKQDT